MRARDEKPGGDSLRGGLWLSVLGHAALAALVLFGARLFPTLDLGGHHPGGAGEGTIVANMVTKVPGGVIPMPSPTNVVTKNRLANNNPGVTVSRPRPRPEPAPHSIPIPVRRRRFQPKDLALQMAEQQLHALARADQPKRPQTRIAYGASGAASFSYSRSAGVGGGGGMAFGDASFGHLYTAWINHLRDRLAYYWGMQYRDPSVPVGRLVYVQFSVNRAGQISDISFGRRSGVPALDAMALHAVQQMAAAETDPLPPAYPHSSLDVRVSFALQ
ncbi:MAG: TonB family protein [Terriglobales bacterium]